MQSIGNKIHLIEQFLTQSNISIFLLSEIWRNENFCNSIVILGYKFAAKLCRKSCSGGVCIIIRDELEYTELKDLKEYSKEYINEFCAIEIPEYNYIFIVLYRGDRRIDIFTEQMIKLMHKLTTKYRNRHIVISGDFNLNVFKSKEKPVKDLLNLMKNLTF